VNPEHVTSYEAGLKAELFDHRLRANLAAFSAKYSDLQVRSPDPVTTLFGLRNAATATIRGIEGELVARPARGLMMTATLSLLEAKYDDYAFTANGTTTDNGGNHLNNAPSFQGSLDTEYEISLGSRGTLTPRLELRYVSDVYFTEANLYPYGAKAHETINARLQYAAPSGKWGVRLFVDNATDQRQPTYAFEGITSDVIGVMIPPPRIYGGQVYVSFR
jgi:iron complex outermembrane receptor protein